MKLPTRQRIVEVMSELNLLTPVRTYNERLMLREVELVTGNIQQSKTYGELRNCLIPMYHLLDKYGMKALEYKQILYRIYQNKEMELKGGGRC